ncbi:MAG: ferredoxin--NADP reductase [Acidimicrobiales bacterium]
MKVKTPQRSHRIGNPTARPGDDVRLRRLPIDQRAFKGSDPRGAPPVLQAAVAKPLGDTWRRLDAYDRRANIVATQQLTSTGTMIVTLGVTDGKGLSFAPGQFIGIEASVVGARRRRTPYCIMSAPDGGDTFSLLVRVVPRGPLSRHLAALEVGDEISFRGPTGRSMIPAHDNSELALIATGVGISPLYALARDLLVSGTERRIRLLWGLRLVQDICLLSELEALVEGYPNFSYEITLSQPDASWCGLKGRVTDVAPAWLDNLGGKRFYLCGNGAMIAEMAAALSEAGVEDRLIYEEAFFDGRHRPDPTVVARLRTRLVDDALLSPVITGSGPLFPLSTRLPSSSGPLPGRQASQP